MSENGMVIVGAGEAGARAAVELRSQGWAGAITLIGEERHAPYERPPLSKEQLFGQGEPLPVTILDERRLEENRIRLLTGSAAIRIDRAAHRVEVAGGERFGYERLLLATGAYPRKLPVKGTAADRLRYLRKFEDALALRDLFQPGKRAAIIGGGFIGLETAAGAVWKGCDVTLVEVAPRILMRGVPEEIARMVEARHRQAGVAFRIGVMIETIDEIGESGGEYAITLADGTVIRCDVIVAGIGAAPETTLAASCGLAIDNGIAVNEILATSDPDIFAAGDCCSFPHPLYEGRRIRLEAWRNAQDQGTHVVRNMLGEAVPYSAVPWFWSDQYDQTLQVAGLADGASTTIVRDLGDAGKLFFHLLEDGRLAAVSGMGPGTGISKDIRIAEMLIEKMARPDPHALSDPARRLKELLRD